MKKLISLALVVMMVCSIALTGFAAPSDDSINWTNIAHVSYDALRHYRADGNYSDGDNYVMGKQTAVTMAETDEGVAFWGWVASKTALVKFTYAVDGGAAVDVARHEAADIMAHVQANVPGATDGCRFNFGVALDPGTHQVVVNAVYADTVETFYVVDVTVLGDVETTAPETTTEAATTAPETTDPSVLDNDMVVTLHDADAVAAYTETSNTTVASKYGFAEITSTGNDPFVFVKHSKRDITLTENTYLALKLKVTEGEYLANGWFYNRTQETQTLPNAGLYKNFYTIDAKNDGGDSGTGEWVIFKYKLPDDVANNGGWAFKMETFDAMRIGAPAGEVADSTLSIAWLGIFDSEDDIAAYDEAYTEKYNGLTGEAPATTTSEETTAPAGTTEADTTDAETAAPAEYKKIEFNEKYEAAYGDTYGKRLGYNNETFLCNVDLTGYKAIKITYGTDGGFTGFDEGMKTKSFWAVAPKLNGGVGWADQEVQNADKILAKVDASPANGAGWAAGERTDIINVADLTYSGDLYLYFFNSIGDEAFVTSVELIPLDAEDVGGNPGTGDLMVVAIAAVAIIALGGAVITKKVRA